MYDYLDLEAPAPPPPPPSSGRSITWSNSPPSSTWDNGFTTSFIFNSAVTAFGSGDAVTFDDTGSNSNAILLNGTLTPNSVTVAATKNYTLSGNGTLSDPMTLTKTGTGVLTVAPALISVLNCTLTVNSSTVTVPSSPGLPAGLVPGMLITVNTNNINGLTDGTTIASITNSTQFILSQNITHTNNGTATLNVSSPNTYSGGTVLQGGTLTLGSVNANDAGLGTGPVTFDGGTLSLFDFSGNNLPGSGTFPNSIVVLSNGTVLAAQRHAISSTVTGGGNLTLSIPYIRTDLTGDWSQFSGQLNVITTNSTEGDLRLAGTTGLPQATVEPGRQNLCLLHGHSQRQWHEHQPRPVVRRRRHGPHGRKHFRAHLNLECRWPQYGRHFRGQYNRAIGGQRHFDEDITAIATRLASAIGRSAAPTLTMAPPPSLPAR